MKNHPSTLRHRLPYAKWLQAFLLIPALLMPGGCGRSGGSIVSFDSGVDQDHCATGEVIHYSATARVTGGRDFDLKSPGTPPLLNPVGRSIQQSTSSTPDGEERMIHIDLSFLCAGPGEVELPPFLLSLDGKDTPSVPVKIRIEPGAPGIRPPAEQRRSAPPADLFAKPPVRI